MKSEIEHTSTTLGSQNMKSSQRMVSVVEPYELPEGWKWCRLGDVADCLDGFRKPINATERADRTGNVPYYGATGQVGWIDDFLTNEELVLLGEDGAPFLDLIKEKAYLISGKAWVNNHAHILRSKYGEIGNRYLLNYLNIFNYSGYVNGTTRLKLTQGEMLKIPFPLPPTLAEQQRIVNRIESMFVKLDEAKEKAQNVVDGFETRKAAILHNAFTGELTAKWRKENGVSDDSWEEKTLGEICSEIKIGPFGSLLHEDDYIENGIPLVNPKHISNQLIKPDTKVSISNEKAEELKSYRLLKNDIVLGRRGEMGRCAPVSENENGWLCGTGSMILRLKPEYQARIYSVLISSHKSVLYFEENAVGSTLKNLNEKIVKNLPIPIISLPEQQEIVRILDNVLEKEFRAKEAAQTVLDQITLLKKSILARAFRGEL